MPILILHNIRSVYNVGSIFRTADAAGVSKIILTGYTPTPLDRFGRERPDLHKVALGAEKSVPWEYIKNPFGAIAKLKSEGVRIVAVEQDSRAASLFKFKKAGKKPVALMVGNEVRGISKPLLAKCDEIVEIPMHGKKESLNVSVAAGIALFEFTKRISE
jgi:23S rRNA (guanosine2251-2'-O)-methyltransferase